MSKLTNDSSIAALAVAAGVFTTSLYLLCERVNSYYTYLSYSYEEREWYFSNQVENLWWIPLAFWQSVIFVVMALIAHRYLTNLKRAPFLLWQSIGIMVLLGWILTGIVIIGLEYLSNPNMYRFVSIVDMFVSRHSLRFAAAAFAGNVLFGTLLQSAIKLYEREQSELIEAATTNGPADFSLLSVPGETSSVEQYQVGSFTPTR